MEFIHLIIVFLICDPGAQNQSQVSIKKNWNEIYASSESWINNISIDVWFGQYL